MTFKSNLKKYISNLPGWRTNRKIVVFESDDWGSIRMPSVSCFDKLEKAGIPVGNIHYNKYDSIENNKDMECLFEVLLSYKDFKGNHPVFTPFCVVANPDFEKIRASNYQNYFYETFVETLKRYEQSDKVYDYWKQGVAKRIFVPQFHGREHLNINRWMRDLAAGNPHTLLAFDYNMWGISSPLIQRPYQAAMDIDKMEDLDFLKNVIQDGLNLFGKLMGYKSTCFVPTNGTINLQLMDTLKEGGIKFVNLNRIQKEPIGMGETRTRINIIGNVTPNSLLVLPRNTAFEPASSSIDWVGKCLNDINISFKLNKPAIISTHRVNFIGSLDIKNSDTNLKKLRLLISEILKKWPSVEFMTTEELGNLISKTK